VRLAAAKALYRALRWAGATNAAPFADAKAMKETTAPWDKRQPYSELEMTKLLTVAEGVDTLMLLLGAHGGLRVSEMTSLRWRDVDLAGRELTVRTGKGRKTRRITLSTSLAQALVMAYNPESERVLPFRTQARAFQRLHRLCRKAGVGNKGIHALRHYAGTRITKEHHGDLEPAARHLGHSSLETTRVYAKWSDEAIKRSVGEW
jgi:integrase/recombinase XerC